MKPQCSTRSAPHPVRRDATRRNDKPRQKLVANLWTEFAAHRSKALTTDGTDLQKLLIFFGGCNF